MRIIPLIVCGGAGSRLWPASRESLPKQFINLIGDRSTFQHTVARVADPDMFAPPVVVTSWDYRYIVTDQLAIIGAEAAILLEPSRRNSGPAIAAGTHYICATDEDALVLVLPADHVIRDEAAFHAAAREAMPSAKAGKIVTFGVKPDRPATGYGYIKPNMANRTCGAYAVDAFVEKPNEQTATNHVASGYLWNSGNFLFRAETLLREYARFDPDTVHAAGEAVTGATHNLAYVVLDNDSFAATRPLSIDVAVMEKTDRASVVPVSMDWSDVGSWQSVWELADKDGSGNAGSDKSVFMDSRDNYVFSEGLVCLLGVSNLAIVQTRDATLVFDRAQQESVKELLNVLKERGQKENSDHAIVFCPWGTYQSLDVGDRFQVKRIVVKPGGRLSLQKHLHRAEHWIVVRGTALVTVGENQKLLHENEITFIPTGTVHRLENPGKIPLELIEVQFGPYLGEDDIIRLEDAYNRA